MGGAQGAICQAWVEWVKRTALDRLRAFARSGQHLYRMKCAMNALSGHTVIASRGSTRAACGCGGSASDAGGPVLKPMTGLHKTRSPKAAGGARRRRIPAARPHSGFIRTLGPGLGGQEATALASIPLYTYRPAAPVSIHRPVTVQPAILSIGGSRST